MNKVYYINISMESLGIVISVILGICIYLSKRQHELANRLYLLVLLCNEGNLLSDIFSIYFMGKMDPLSIMGSRITDFLNFIFGFSLIASFSHYLIAFFDQHIQVSKYFLLSIRILCGFGAILTFLNSFFPIFYYIDAENMYHRAGIFWLSQVICILCMLVDGFILLKYRKEIDSQSKMALWSCIALPVFALSIQLFNFGLSIANLSCMLAMIIVFMLIQAEQGKRMAEQEEYLQQSRIAIMLSQIQPHFLYNSLNSISYLCTKDPEAAQAAVKDFAVYLHANLDSLSQVNLVPFDKELEHVKTYLSLEKRRFGDEINVVYDIQVNDFRLPTLTVQPLVENAVKHGLAQQSGGGTIRISTSETSDSIKIIVSDDGVGFGCSEMPDKGNSHIGIENVRQRLKTMCRGNLIINSTPGKGTNAVITLPKEKQK